MNKTAACIYCKKLGKAQRDGINILGNFICSTCEEKMINTKCCSTNYIYYINGLKKIWRCLGD
ncbi:MAG: sigma-G inhibitor, Gin [Desulfotomaculum sp.]|nr:sigma-G inhibitor, Gin [Desulfotomaculum sp.]